MAGGCRPGEGQPAARGWSEVPRRVVDGGGQGDRSPQGDGAGAPGRLGGGPREGRRGRSRGEAPGCALCTPLVGMAERLVDEDRPPPATWLGSVCFPPLL